MRTPSIDRVSVLHVDDEPRFTEMVGEFLEREDERFTVRTAARVSEAVSVLADAEIDCVVSDYDMPETDGLEFLELVRDEYPDLPFILFTGKGSEEIASRAISAGVTEYLQKGGGTEQYTVLANRILNTVRAVRAETEIRRTEERYHNLVDTAPIPIVLFDREMELIYSNEAARDFVNADTHADLQGTTMPEFLQSPDQDVAKARFEKLMSEETPLPERTFQIRTVDGTQKTATVATAPGYYRGAKVAQVMVYQ